MDKSFCKMTKYKCIWHLCLNVFKQNIFVWARYIPHDNFIQFNIYTYYICVWADNEKKTDIYIFLISYFMFYIIIIIIIIIIIALDDKRVSKDQISIFLTIPLCVSSVCWLFSISSLNLSCPTHTDTKHLHGFYALTRQNRACQEERQRESLWLILVTLVQIHSGGSLLSSLYFSL